MALPNKLPPLLPCPVQSNTHTLNLGQTKLQTYKWHHCPYHLSYSLQPARADNFLVCNRTTNREVAEPQKINVFVIMIVSLAHLSANFIRHSPKCILSVSLLSFEKNCRLAELSS